jgi:hypothetical protein
MNQLHKRFEDGKAWARAHPVICAMVRGFSYALIIWFLFRMFGAL